MPETMYFVQLIISTFIMGFAVKYTDASYEHDAFKRMSAVIAAICGGFLAGYWMATDSSAAVFLLAIILSVAIAKKIKNAAFALGVIIALLVPVILMNVPDGAKGPEMALPWLPFAALVLAGVIGEMGKDYRKSLPLEGMRMFFDYRVGMIVMMAALTYFRFIEVPYLLALISFGLGYQLVSYYVKRKMGIQEQPEF